MSCEKTGAQRALPDRPNQAGTTQHSRMPWGLLIAAFVFIGPAACATHNVPYNMPDVGHALKTGLACQVIRPEAPLDRFAAQELPGDLANQIYIRRYIRTMTKDEDEDDQKATQEFQ